MARSIRALMINVLPVYWSFSVWTVILGIVLMIAPDNWFGASWHYFHQLPHNGFWMGVTCAGLGGLQMVSLWRDHSYRILSILFFLNGFVYWTAGIIFAAAGLFGHQGLMESPFMCYVGAHAFAHSAALMARYRNGGSDDE